MLLKKAESETAYLTASIYGFPGSGKSFTAACIAIGLWHYIRSPGPIAFIDTEAGTDFLLPHFKHNSIGVLRSKSRAFADILPIMKEAKNAGAEILIIDSCTHLWQELITAYEKKYNRRNGLQFQDWKYVKGEWGEFMTAVICEPMHKILLGRAGYEYDYIDVDDSGKKTLVKTATKMRAEGQTEHEPSITLEMEQQTLSDDEIKELARKQKAGIPQRLTGQFANYIMYVLKDRSNLLTGSVFKYPPRPGEMIDADNPPFNDILPFIQSINIGGIHKGVDTGRSSEDMFAGPDDSYTENKKRKIKLIEELEIEMKSRFGTSKDDRAKLRDLLKEIFQTSSWTAIKDLPLNRLEVGYGKFMMSFQGNERGDDANGQINQMPAGASMNGNLSKSSSITPADLLNEYDEYIKEGKFSRGDVEGWMARMLYPKDKDPFSLSPLIRKVDWRATIKFGDEISLIFSELRAWYVRENSKSL